jgi:hypothetical protein
MSIPLAVSKAANMEDTSLVRAATPHRLAAALDVRWEQLCEDGEE